MCGACIFIFSAGKETCCALVNPLPCTRAILRPEAVGLILINADTMDSVSTLSNSSSVNEMKGNRRPICCMMGQVSE